MPRGGFRRGAGRKLGVANRATRELVTLIEAMPEGDLIEQLAAVAEDPKVSREVRLSAMRHVFGALCGRTIYLGSES